MATQTQSLPQSLADESQAKSVQTKDPSSWVPTTKVSTGALAGAFTVLLSAIFGPLWKNWTQQDLTPAVAAAITTILTFAIQWSVPEANRKS
ncbi:MAG TPA: hypothetical protein VMU45_04700 [Candidatus Eisenbacteria bacterium]|nr:hypothetical protein [Candidatus Eisenbacteria bacterium]